MGASVGLAAVLAFAFARPPTATGFRGGDTVLIGADEVIDNDFFISRSTVKRHIANAYGKLGVGHRTEAVARANELNLL